MLKRVENNSQQNQIIRSDFVEILVIMQGAWLCGTPPAPPQHSPPTKLIIFKIYFPKIGYQKENVISNIYKKYFAWKNIFVDEIFQKQFFLENWNILEILKIKKILETYIFQF